MFAPLTNWLTRQWDNQGSHFNAGWPPRIMTSSMVTLRPPSHLKLNQCKGKWLNKKAGRTTCTTIASMNVKNKHTSNNNIIRSSWLHTKLHDLVTDPELQTLWTALGRKFSTTWVAGAFWSWAVTFSFIKSGWKMNGQWLLMNQWDPILHKGPLKCFRAFQRIQVRGHQLMAQFGSFLRLQPIDKLHDSRLHKTADWQQRPWAQINSQYDFWTHQTVSNFIHLKCFCIFQQTLNGESITHRSKLTVLLTHRGPRGKSLQRKWNFSSRVRSTQIMNNFDISVFYSTIQQTTADNSIHQKCRWQSKQLLQTDWSFSMPASKTQTSQEMTNKLQPANQWLTAWLNRTFHKLTRLVTQQQLVNFQAIDSQTNDPVSLSLMINDRINLRKKCCPWINDNLCICLPTYTSIHWCHVGLLYSKRSKTTDGDVSKWGGCCWFQKGTRVLSIQGFSLFRIDTYPHSYLKSFRFHPELAASMPGRWKRWNPEHWQR